MRFIQLTLLDGRAIAIDVGRIVTITAGEPGSVIRLAVEKGRRIAVSESVDQIVAALNGLSSGHGGSPA